MQTLPLRWQPQLSQDRQRSPLGRTARPRFARSSQPPLVRVPAAPSRRDQLVLDHQDLVRSIALALKNTLFLYADLDDLIGAGNAGLLEAATSFDPASGAAFATWARHRIRGYILDSTSKWYRQALTHKPIAEIANSDRHSTKPDLRKFDLREARKRLSEQQQSVLGYYYDKDWSMWQIADVMGLSTARISQIHNEALIELRKHLS